MSDAKSALVRDGTMQTTAKEGIDYLKSEGKGRLLKAQGLVEDKPSVPRDGTMLATAKEADRILDGNKPDADAQTRGQQKQIEEIKKEEPPAKKTKLAKDTTMAATAKEAKELLSGEKLGDTRQETSKQKSKARTPLKKNKTITKTMEEAKFILDGDVDLNAGRKTRSQSLGTPGKPSLKKAGTMVNTAKEGKEFLKRSKGVKKVAEPKNKTEEEAA